MKTEYAKLFDGFVRSRGIDEDDAYWTADDWEAWNKLLAEANL